MAYYCGATIALTNKDKGDLWRKDTKRV